MPTEQTEILVLKKTKLAETDLIVTAFSKTGTQIRAVVKGGRKPGSHLGAHLELFARTRVLLYHGRTLDTVTDAEALDRHGGCLQNPEHTAAASALAELLESLSRDAAADPRLFGLTDVALSSIALASDAGLPLLLAAGLLKQAAEAGFMPSLNVCVRCGRDFPAGSGGGSFSYDQGGVICAQCWGAARGSSAALDDIAEPDFRPEASAFASATPGSTSVFVPTNLAPALLAWLDRLLHSRFCDLQAYATADYADIGRNCLDFCRAWIAMHITPRLRSLDFYYHLE